jgi:hypothetical protein
VETKIRLDINMPSAEIVTHLLTSMNAPPGTLLRYRIPGQKKKQDSHPFTTEEQIRSAMRQVRKKNNKATKHKDQHLNIVRAVCQSDVWFIQTLLTLRDNRMSTHLLVLVPSQMWSHYQPPLAKPLPKPKHLSGSGWMHVGVSFNIILALHTTACIVW